MPAFHFYQCHDSFPVNFSQSLARLGEIWGEPYFRIQRIVFSSPTSLGPFLDLVAKEAGFSLDFGSEMTDQQQTALSFSLHGGTNFLYEFPQARDFFSRPHYKPDLVLYAENTPTSLERLAHAMEDKFPEIKGISPPHFGLILPDYFLDLTHPKPQRRKRATRVSIAQKRGLKKNLPAELVDQFGPQYYGHKVFQAYAKMLLASRQNHGQPPEETEEILRCDFAPLPFPIPPAPLKYFDFQGDQASWVEMRFNSFFDYQYLPPLWDALIPMLGEGQIMAVQIQCVYNAWQSEIFYKKASHDTFFLSWGDPELDFRQQNLLGLHNHLNHYYSPTAYVQFTHMVDENDFRVEKMREAFGDKGSFILR